MSSIRIAKVMAIRVVTIAMFVLILMLSTTLTDVIAAERIPDSELAALYGGTLYYNPYCGVGRSCPSHVPACLTEEIMDNCRFCHPLEGEVCVDYWGAQPDPDGCTDDTEDCINANKWPNPSTGYCGAAGCIGAQWPDPPFPECNEESRDTCVD